MATPHDPDFDPIRPQPGAPDQLGVVRASRPTAQAEAPAFAAGAPDIRPASPGAWWATVPLDHALVIDGETLAVVTIRRPTGADIAELLEEDETEATLPTRLRARICGVHPAVFPALWADDAERVAAAVRPFVPRAILDIEEDQEPASESA